MTKFPFSAEPAAAFSTPCLLLPLWQDGELDGAAASLNSALNGLIAQVRSEDGFSGKVGESRTLYNPGDGPARIQILGLGKRGKCGVGPLQTAFAKGARAIRGLRRTEFAVALPQVANLSVAQVASAAVEGIGLGLHLFNDFKTGPDQPIEVATVTLLAAVDAEIEAAVTRSMVMVAANLRARQLVNAPPNLQTPEVLAQTAREIAAASGMRCEVWDEARILEERMGALFAVGMGSAAKPRFIVLEYIPEGTQQNQPIALVGKGMTFDSGGYSLKPPGSMEDMKDDMAGAAVVLAAMEALPQLGVKQRVLGVVASAENMVSSRAQRPGDIVTARNGKTIEVLNTDAEGRLILADALAWTCEQDPFEIVDFATLTGAIGITLGQEGAGVLGNDKSLWENLIIAGENCGEKLWPLPLWDEYQDYVKGTVSDLKNIGPERRAGSIVGAIFLENFVNDEVPWAHLDIAAVSLVRTEKLLTVRGATGYGVRLILNHLLAQ